MRFDFGTIWRAAVVLVVLFFAASFFGGSSGGALAQVRDAYSTHAPSWLGGGGGGYSRGRDDDYQDLLQEKMERFQRKQQWRAFDRMRDEANGWGSESCTDAKNSGSWCGYHW